MLYLGIDLGTTYSLVAYINDHGLPTLFPDHYDANDFRTPSVVHISDEGCLVGTALEELLDDSPEMTQARFFKLEMAEETAVYADHLGRQWLPSSLSALVLKKLLQDVEVFANEEVAGALIAVPANFNDAQRRATKQAATMAGLAHVKLIEEPIAAATFYGYSKKGGEQTLFVYDLGGGTFDATVLQVGMDGLYALATEGDNGLGGKNVDELIIAFILDEYHRQHGFTPTDELSLYQLRQFAQTAKVTLSKPTSKKVAKTLVLSGKTMDFILSKERFNQLINDFVDKTLVVCEQCLKSSGLSWGMIDTVLLTGGSSLLSLVYDKLSLASGKPKDALICKQPHQAVAYGTAILAEQQFKTGGMNQSKSGIKKLQTICSYDLGIRTTNKQGKPEVKTLISKNSPIPNSSSMTFYTNRADQKRIIIEAVQVNTEEQKINESSLGYFAFGIDRPEKNYPIEISLAYNIEGIVTVTANDKKTGQEIKQVMDSTSEILDKKLLEQQSWINKVRING